MDELFASILVSPETKVRHYSSGKRRHGYGTTLCGIAVDFAGGWFRFDDALPHRRGLRDCASCERQVR